jgi:hypothetical protein
MTSDTDFYVEKYFITEKERLAIKQKVIELKNLWDFYTDPTPNGVIPFYTLGNALYLMEITRTDISGINQPVRQVLIQNFGWLYQRICDKLTMMTGLNTKLHPRLTVPGFHIGDIPGNYKIDRFHKDGSIESFDPDGSIDTAYSILIPIEIPSAGARLQYLDNEQEKRFEYELGALLRWKATLRHKIGDSILQANEYRITLQCHYYHNTSQNLNYVYF